MEKYADDGTLRIEWRDFPYLGEESKKAAVAARAAQEQGRFWDYHDVLYENQRGIDDGAFSDENLVEYARQAGLDVDRFEAVLGRGEYEAVVDKVFREAQDAGIPGTPTFDVNGKLLVGPQPIETFEETIEEAAREAEGQA